MILLYLSWPNDVIQNGRWVVGYFEWRHPIDEIPWNPAALEQCHKYHNAPFPYLTMHHSEQKYTHFWSGDHFTKNRASFQSELPFTFATCDRLVRKACFQSQLAVFHEAKGELAFPKASGHGYLLSRKRACFWKSGLAFVKENLTNHGTSYMFSGSQKASNFVKRTK